jgi:ADP-heptose:LPS heptosyltransferase
MKSLISKEKLSQSKRLLYMTHMAMGDYVYQRMFLKRLQEVYPHLHIDLWFDNCSSKEGAWNLERSKTLTQWFKEEPFLHHLYPVAASLQEREEMIARAQQEQYDIIIFSVDLWCEDYARVARRISKEAYIVGTLLRLHLKILEKIKTFKGCNNFICASSSMNNTKLHITEFYQRRFERLLGLKTTQEEIRPVLDVPEYWQKHMRVWLEKEKQKNYATQKTVFINYLSTNKKRDWSFEQARELIIALNKLHPHSTYILNLPPYALQEIQKNVSEDKILKNIHVVPFSAQEHFYELPALIQLSNWVFSVETAVIHLASALSIPQIALVRRKGKAWAPLKNEKTWILFTKPAFHSRISHITVDEVVDCYKRHLMP